MNSKQLSIMLGIEKVNHSGWKRFMRFIAGQRKYYFYFRDNAAVLGAAVALAVGVHVIAGVPFMVGSTEITLDDSRLGWVFITFACIVLFGFIFETIRDVVKLVTKYKHKHKQNRR